MTTKCRALLSNIQRQGRPQRKKDIQAVTAVCTGVLVLQGIFFNLIVTRGVLLIYWTAVPKLASGVETSQLNTRMQFTYTLYTSPLNCKDPQVPVEGAKHDPEDPPHPQRFML